MKNSHKNWVISIAVAGLAAGALAPLAGSATATTASTSAASAASAPAPSLFGEAPPTTAKMAQQRLGDQQLKRSRFVSFRAAALPSAARGQQVSLPFFDDATFRGEVDHMDKQPLLTSWSGPLADGSGTFVVTKTDDTYQVTASTMQGSFTMNQTLSGAFQVAEVVQPTPDGADTMTTAIPTRSHRTVSASQRAAEAAQSAALADQAVLMPSADRKGKKRGGGGRGDDGSVQDILVMYTPDAAATYGGVPGIVGEAAKNIGYTNAAYAASGVKTSVRLVGVVPTATAGRVGDGIYKDINAFIKKGDGRFDEIFKYIKQTHADDSVLLEAPAPADAAVCGIAAHIRNQPAKYAFAVVSTGSCTDGYYSFPHELGHNQGASHDLWTLKNSPVGKGSLDAQYRYGYGYVSPDYRFYTTMAYYEECYYVGKVVCPQLLSFSNPDVYAYGETTGTKKRNNVSKLITKTRKTVANHQQSTLYLRGKVAVSPKPAAGRRVHVTFKGWVNTGRIKTKFQWYLDGVPIKHAKGRFYKVKRKDKGHALAVVVTGEKRYYSTVSVGSKARTVKGK